MVKRVKKDTKIRYTALWNKIQAVGIKESEMNTISMKEFYTRIGSNAKTEGIYNLAKGLFRNQDRQKEVNAYIKSKQIPSQIIRPIKIGQHIPLAQKSIKTTKKIKTKRLKKILSSKTIKNKYSGFETDIYTTFYYNAKKLTNAYNLSIFRKTPKANQFVHLVVKMEAFKVSTNLLGQQITHSVGVFWQTFTSFGSQKTDLVNLYDVCVRQLEAFIQSKNSLVFVILEAKQNIFRRGYLK